MRCFANNSNTLTIGEASVANEMRKIPKKLRSFAKKVKYFAKNEIRFREDIDVIGSVYSTIGHIRIYGCNGVRVERCFLNLSSFAVFADAGSNRSRQDTIKRVSDI